MKKPNLLLEAAVFSTIFLTACGGGGGTSGSSTNPPVPVQSLASLAAKDLPAQFPGNFKTIVIKKNDLITDAEISKTTNKSNAIFIQIWFLDQDQQRQTVAFLTLDALTRTGGSLNISNIPRGVRVLKTEVYTQSGAVQQTLANKEIAV